MTPDEVSDADHELWRRLYSRGISTTHLTESGGLFTLDLRGTGWITYPDFERVIQRRSLVDLREAVNQVVLDNGISDR